MRKRLKQISVLFIAENVLFLFAMLICLVGLLAIILSGKDSYDFFIERRAVLNRAERAISVFNNELETIKNPDADILYFTMNEIRYVSNDGNAKTFKCLDNSFLINDTAMLSGIVSRCEIFGFNKDGVTSYNRKDVVRINLKLSVEAKDYGRFTISGDAWLKNKSYYENFSHN